MTGLAPEIAHGLRLEIDEQLAYFASLWPKHEEEDNTEAPHRQRTIVNRLMGYAMFLGMPTAKEQTGAEPIRRLRRWQKRLGPVRDTDVILGWVAQVMEEGNETAHAAGQQLSIQLRERRRCLAAAVRPDARGLAGAQTRVAAEEVRLAFHARLDELLDEPDAFRCEQALHQVALPWRDALTILADDQSDEMLHSFRVRNKRLRFVLDVLAGALGDKAHGPRAKTCGRVHTALGNLSDLRVLRDELRRARADWAVRGLALDDSADALEDARTHLERANLREWYSLYPVIAHPGFIEPLANA